MNFRWKPKKYLITTLRVIGWICFSILGLLVLISLSIQIPYVQNKLTQKVITFLEKKIGTDVNLERISLSIPKKLVLTGLYLEDQQRDTLLYAGELAIDTDLWKLTQQTIQLNEVELTNFQGSVTRSESDSSFNFSYILDAFNTDTTTTKVDTTQAPWKFSIGSISLEKIRILFKDNLMGNEIALRLGILNLGMDEFDLEESIFKADEIDIENLTAEITQTKRSADTVEQVDDTAAAAEMAFDLGVNQINLKDINARYNHRATGQVASLKLKELVLEAEEIDMKNRSINLNEFRLHDTFVSYQQLAGYKVPAPEKDSSSTNNDNESWHITLGKLDLENNSIQLYDFDKPFQKEIFDVNHLWITKFNTQASNLEWEGMTMKGDISDLTFQERSGFAVESMSGMFAMSDNSINVKDFSFKSPNSEILVHAEGKFTSLKTLSDSYPDASVDMTVQKSSFGLRDIYYFAPTLLDSLPLNIPRNTTIRLDTRIVGQLKNLRIDHLIIEALAETYLSARGNLQLRKNEDPYFALELEKFYTTKRDIQSILPDTLIPSSITLPDWLNVSASGKGTVLSPDAKAVITSNFGTIALDAQLKRNRTSGTSKYKGTLDLKEFQTGKLLKQEESLGPLTLSLSVDGSGLTMEDLDTRINLQINHFSYQGYDYKNFALHGAVKQYLFDGDAQFQDENLDFKLAGDLNYNEDVPKYHFTFELKNADFKALKLTSRPLKARGTLNVDLATADFKVINGKLDIRKFAIFNGKDMYAVDSLLFASIDQEGQSEISLRSDIVDGDFKGTINLYSLPEVIRRHVDNYFSLHDTTYNKPAAPQNFEFGLRIKNTDLLTEIIFPDLDPFVPGEIVGAFDSNEDRLDLNSRSG